MYLSLTCFSLFAVTHLIKICSRDSWPLAISPVTCRRLNMRQVNCPFSHAEVRSTCSPLAMTMCIYASLTAYWWIRPWWCFPIESYISCTLFIIYWTARFIMQVELRKLNTGSSIHMPNVHLLMCCGLLLGYHLHNSWHYYFFFCLERMIAVWISLVYYKNTRLPSRFVLWSTLSEEVYSSSDFVHWTASIWSTVNNLRGSFNTSPSATNYTLVKNKTN